jgi:hypothetical protein
VPFSIQVVTCGGNFSSGVAIFIDYDQSGTFDPITEIAFSSSALINGPYTVTGSFIVPLTATVGLTKMRVLNIEQTALPVPSACGTYGYGETEDYLINIVATSVCMGLPSPGNTIASANPACPNTNVILSLQFPPLTTSNTFQWFNNTGLIAGATNNTYTITNFNAPDDYYCDVTCTNSGLTSPSGLINLSVNNYFRFILWCYFQCNIQYFK